MGKEVTSTQDDATVNEKTTYWVGIIFAILATFIFACQDAITKTLVAHYPISFIVMVRFWFFLAAGIYMVSTASGRIKNNIKTKRPIVQCLRSLFLLGELVCIAIAFRHMGLAEATSLFEAYPLFGTLFAIILLKEQVGVRRIGALIVGFIGILIMLRPGVGVMSDGTVWAIAACILFALYLALTRMVGGIDKPQTSFFYVGLVGCVVTTAGLPYFWQPMAGQDIWFLLALCFMSIAGHFFMIKALSLVPLTIVQPFNYLQLVWSVIIGYIIFSDMPDLWTFTGAFIVVGSGLFVFYREQFRPARINPSPSSQ